MGFKLLILRTGAQASSLGMEGLTDRLRAAVPDIEVNVADSDGEAMEVIEEVDAAFGIVSPQLLERAKMLRWIASAQAGPKAGYYYPALVESDVVVTNAREIYNDHIGAHIMAYLLAFAKGLHLYMPQQLRREWRPGYEPVHLPEATVLIVGLGGIGGEAARLCSAFGMTVVGVDPRRTEAPPGVAELHRPDALHDLLPRGDFVIVTVPETPETRGSFAAPQFRLMKETAFFINIGRGATVVLDDLVAALGNGDIAGAGLDVYELEPLPSDHPLWTARGALLTPHVAGLGPYVSDRRADLLVDNCVRFNEGRPLRNVVDKSLWF